VRLAGRRGEVSSHPSIGSYNLLGFCGQALWLALRLEGSTFMTLIGQSDFYEGPKSFVEKRKPSFKQDD
jgi:hypothetical protein